MQIDAIDLYHLSIPCRGDLRAYWSIAALAKDFPAPPDRWETVFIRLRGGDVEGWGECSPGAKPIETGEWAAGAFLLLRDVVAPALLGQDIRSAEQLGQQLPRICGNALARSAVDQAVWDLLARQQNAPLHQLLGGQSSVRVRAAVRVADSLDEVMAAVRLVHAAGFGEVNIKMQATQSEVLRAIRQEFPALALAVDCDGQGNLNQQAEFCRLDDFFLKSLEQPLRADDLVGHAMLAQQVRTPICLDQSISSLERLQDAVEFQSCRQVRIEPGRLGGLSHAKAVIQDALASQIVCGLATRVQTAVGQRGTLALGTSLGSAEDTQPLYADYFPAAEFFESDAAEPLATERDAQGQLMVRLSDSPGIGFTPDTAWLKQYCVEESRI